MDFPTCVVLFFAKFCSMVLSQPQKNQLQKIICRILFLQSSINAKIQKNNKITKKKNEIAKIKFIFINIFRNQHTKNPHNGTKSSAMIEANYLSSCTEIYF